MDTISNRFEALKRGWIDSEFFKKFYGFSIEEFMNSSIFQHIIKYWNCRNEEEVVNSDNFVNIAFIESWLDSAMLVTFKQAAVELGMSQKSLSTIMRALDSSLPHEFFHYERLFVKKAKLDSFEELILCCIKNYCPSLPHDDRCRALHRCIEEKITIKPEPIFCSNASLAGKQHFAQTYCVLSDEPISIPFSIKFTPFQNMAFRCSLKTYFENESLFGGHTQNGGYLLT